MPILKGRRANGHPITVTLPTGPSLATSYTMTQSASSGTTGAADTLIISPVGGVWPTGTITISASSGVSPVLTNGFGGTLSGSVLTVPAGTTTLCTVTMTPGAAGTATISATNSAGMTNPGNLTYTVSSGGTPGTIPNFSLAEWSGTSSTPLARVGMAFAPGDVPSGYTPVIGGVSGQQFDQRAVHPDGSLRFAVAHLRDASSFTANQSRSYSVTPTSGSFNNTGSLTMAGVLAGHDFKVSFSNVKQYNTATDVVRGSGASDTLPNTPISAVVLILGYTQGIDYTISGATITWIGAHVPSTNALFTAVYLSGSYSDTTHGSGSFTASLNTHIATATRITKIHSGPVCEGWVVWGMARDNTGGAADAHLKTYWHIDCWKNADGSVYAIEVAALVALDWYSIPNKFRLDYDAVLLDGATTIQSYPGVQHPYNSWWLTCRTNADYNRGKRHWVGGAISTLTYKPDRAYWIKSGLMAPYDLTLSPASLTGSLLTYTPCRAGPTGNNITETGLYHRVSIDDTGTYPGRGLVPLSDAVAFVKQSTIDVVNARINAHAGLGVPYHFRSNHNRTRPGETADTASTVIAQKLDNPNRATGWDNCTADGMPAPVYCYKGYNDSTYTDGYVEPGGGCGVWSPGGDASHLPNFCYFIYLLEGENYHFEATVDFTTFSTIQLSYPYGFRGPLLADDSAYAALSIPSAWYGGIPGIWKPTNQRAICFALNVFGCATGIAPTDHVAYSYLQKWQAQVGDWVGVSLQYMPASQKALGAFYPAAWKDGVDGQGEIPGWFIALTALGAYSAYRVTGDTRFRDLGDCAANLPIGLYAAGRTYMTDQYHITDRPKMTNWSTSNEFWAPGNVAAFNMNVSVIDHASGLLSSDLSEGGGQNQVGGSLSMTNGDKWSPSQGIARISRLPIPSEIAEGTIYYLRDVTMSGTGAEKSATYRIAATPGGTAITFSANTTTDFGLQWWPQDAVHPVAANPPYIFPMDTYASMMAAAIEMAKACGNAAATSAIVSAERTFMAPIDKATSMPWALKAV